MGIEGARDYAETLLSEAIDALNEFGDAASELKQLGHLMVHRSF
jgi:geranylgeranyl pyrophosphate synthase